MLIGNGIISALHAQAVRDAEDICQSMSFRRSKLKAGHLQQLTIGVTEVDRIHEAAINGTCIFNSEFLQARRHLGISCARNVIGNVMQVTNILWIRRWVITARRADEESDQASVAWVKIKMQ